MAAVRTRGKEGGAGAGGQNGGGAVAVSEWWGVSEGVGGGPSEEGPSHQTPVTQKALS